MPNINFAEATVVAYMGKRINIAAIGGNRAFLRSELLLTKPYNSGVFTSISLTPHEGTITGPTGRSYISWAVPQWPSNTLITFDWVSSGKLFSRVATSVDLNSATYSVLADVSGSGKANYRIGGTASFSYFGFVTPANETKTANIKISNFQVILP